MLCLFHCVPLYICLQTVYHLSATDGHHGSPTVLSYIKCYKLHDNSFPLYIERFHRGRGLFLLLAVVTGFYMLKVPNW